MVGWSLVQGLYYPKFVGDYQDPLLSHLLTNSACFINGCILMFFFILSLEPREILCERRDLGNLELRIYIYITMGV